MTYFYRPDAFPCSRCCFFSLPRLPFFLLSPLSRRSPDFLFPAPSSHAEFEIFERVPRRSAATFVPRATEARRAVSPAARFPSKPLDQTARHATFTTALRIGCMTRSGTIQTTPLVAATPCDASRSMTHATGHRWLGFLFSEPALNFRSCPSLFEWKNYA